MEIISILIATYNSEATIENALMSVKQQTYQNFECIIIDGLSTDNTLEIIKQISSKDLRFKYFSEKDKGVYDALNKGVSKCIGEWIYVLGSDDELLPKALEIFISNSDSKIDIIYGNVLCKYKSGIIHQGEAKPIKSIIKQMPASHQAMLMKKKIFTDFNSFDLQFKICADYNLLLCAYMNNRKIYKINDFIANVRIDGLSSASIPIFKEYYQIYKKNNSNNYPLFWSCYYGFRWFIAKKILDKFRNYYTIKNNLNNKLTTIL